VNIITRWQPKGKVWPSSLPKERTTRNILSYEAEGAQIAHI